ncbi:VWA domain-containing protein [Janibacter cremeus]|uniref:VWA domain-containing protein n=1 Tax=Janibacter cremeus TaxID=1285192 RepID=UPI0023F79FAA|nr:VWA domain-containing protein [Janibacter cremeus]WEV79683.1 VWA domain-containing protein [Janibacter cremeus]
MHTSTAPVRALLGAGLAGVVAFTGAVATAATADTQTGTTATSATEEPGELLLMLDASGSMKESDPAGGTKMQAAKTALTGVVESLPSDTNVGLRVYGATEEGGKPTKAACNDTQLAVPIGPLDKPALTRAIKGFEAKGETPIAHSLTKAMDDLGDTGKRNIVLVSDGEESCVPDPCPVVKDLVQDGVDLRIDTVGFGVEDTAREQLQCIAETGGGTYYDAADADELANSLNKISTRAVRDFGFTGQPVTGTDLAENEQAPADLPTLTPGLWTDELTASEDSWRAYTIERTQKQSTLHVSVTTKPKTYYNREEDDADLENLYLTILAPDGTECADEFGIVGDFHGFKRIVTVTGHVLGQSPEEEPASESCRAMGTFTALVHREGAQQTTPTEIQVIEEPRVTNLPELPDAAGDLPEAKDLTAGEAQPIAGGLSFSDAPAITEGTWVDTLVPGETLVYRVKVDYGQTARFTTHGPTGGFRFPADIGRTNYLLIDGEAFSPDRQKVDESVRAPGQFNPAYSSPGSVRTANVRYKNRYANTSTVDATPAASMSGWYYYALGVSTKEVGEDLAGQPIKVAFTVDLEGKPTNLVEYASEDETSAEATDKKQADDSGDTGSKEAGAAAAATSDEGGSPLPWVGGGLLAAIVLGAGAWFGLRRKGAGAQESARSQE